MAKPGFAWRLSKFWCILSFVTEKGKALANQKEEEKALNKVVTCLFQNMNSMSGSFARSFWGLSGTYSGMNADNKK